MYQLSPQSLIYISFYSLSLFPLQIKGIYIILELLVAFLAVSVLSSDILTGTR